METNNSQPLMNKGKRQMTGHLCMFMATLFFGLNIPALKILIPKWISFTDATLIRIFGATILFWIISLFIKNDKIERKDWWIIAFSGVIGLFSFLFLFALSIELTSPIDLSIIMTTPPILVVIISSIIYKTRISKKKMLGIFIALVGALIIILTQHKSNGVARSLKGNMFAILSGICYAIYLIALKGPSERYKPITLLRWVFLFSCIPAIPFAFNLFDAKLFNPIKPEPIIYSAFVVLFPTFLSYLLIPVSIKRIGHELVSMYQYLLPVIATTAAIIMKLDRLQWDQPIAALFIIYGVYLTSQANNKKKDKKTPTDLDKSQK